MKLKLVLLLFTAQTLSAQKIDNLISYRNIESDSYFRFNYENDFFAAADRNYTQGYNMELVTPGLKKNPVNFLFLKPKNAATKYGISIEHIGFTPRNYVSPEIRVNDRPFASAITLKSFAIAMDLEKKQRISQSFSLGVIGPAAFAKEMQTAIHKAIGDKKPGGWGNQIQNDVVLNYKLDYEKQLLNFNDIFTLQGTSNFQAGTLFTNASVGGNATFGLINSPFSVAGNEKKFQLYVYAEPIARVVAYDATLQGGVFNDSSPYAISSNGVERFTGQFNYGLVIRVNKLYLEYAQTKISREFTTGEAANWGGVKIGFGW
ncbi:MAG: lipid A deacylase LpxR family protein [Spirosomaceae bacterium]|nr:lipid A deacylase LpxR family protein [Spirosomataceae bacterium]